MHWLACLMMAMAIMGCGSETVLRGETPEEEPTPSPAPAPRTPSALTVQPTGGWLLEGFEYEVWFETEVTLAFDNSQGTQPGVAAVEALYSRGAPLYVCGEALSATAEPCPEIAVPAGEIVEQSFRGSVFGDVPFDVLDCSDALPSDTRPLEVSLRLDGAASTQTYEVQRYCVICEDGACVSVPENPPE